MILENQPNPIQIYQADNGALEILVDSKQETIWLNLNQISILFQKDKSVISRHIKNIYIESELDENSTLAFFATVQKEGDREVKRSVEYYNLDLIISVGYRTSSKQATKFRKWASGVLKDYLLKGYSINQKLLEQKTEQIEEIQQTLAFLAKSGQNLQVSEPFLEILQKYTQSLIILNQFDEDRLKITTGNQAIRIEIAEFRQLISQTKQELMAKNEASELFGQEYEGKFESTIATIYQTFGGQDLYPSLEEKAANLLYLIIKNHGFVDGNKRIGSILFVYFLAKNKFLSRKNGELKINENTLVALALLVAQSKPEDKQILIQLIIKLIQD